MPLFRTEPEEDCLLAINMALLRSDKRTAKDAKAFSKSHSASHSRDFARLCKASRTASLELRQDTKLALICTERDAEAFDLAVEGGDFYSKELCGASLIASRPLQRLTD